MNSTLKPVLPTSSQPTTSTTPTKPMHPQGAPVSYGQPSGTISQNPYPNTNMAHAHTASQQNHFSLSSGSHFSMGTIPASNHPVAIAQPTGAQVYTPPKNVSYSSGFQHAQNQNILPPVSQTLPATASPSSAPQQSPSATQNPNSNTNLTPQNKEPSVEKEKPQPNGTPEEEEPPTPAKVDKPETQENHVTPQPSSTPEPPQTEETKSATQASPQELTTEKPKLPIVPPQEIKAVPESPKEKVVEDNVSAPVPTPAPVPAAVPAATVAAIPLLQPSPVPTIPPTPVSEPATPSTPPKEAVEPESVQNDTVPGETESPKDAPETDPLAIETTATEIKPAVDQDKNVPEVETETKEESEGEEQSSEEASESGKGQKDEDPLSKTPPKTPARKTKIAKQEPKTEPKPPIQKSPSTGKTKRQRMMTQHYQSPLPEIEIITKISSSTPRNRNNDDKLIYFYKNEFLAVRNADGGFYLCQAVQNVYKSSSKIKIRWLSQDKSDKSGEIYTPDFYDLTDFDCILTSLDLTRVGKGRYKLKPKEKERTDSILKRCLAVEKGEISQPSLSEEHPDGLDLSLYKDEEQLMKNKKRGIKRKGRPRSVSARKVMPIRKAPEAPKVRKVEITPTRSSLPSKKVLPVKKAVVPEPKKAPVTSRSARGKRKSDTKTSPVIDQKKAKVLAKIGRKAGIPASSSKLQTSSKSAKVSKPTPSTSKVTKPAPVSSKPPPRKAKRSSRNK